MLWHNCGIRTNGDAEVFVRQIGLTPGSQDACKYREGANLRDKRQIAQLRQERVASTLGYCERQVISRIEKGASRYR